MNNTAVWFRQFLHDAICAQQVTDQNCWLWSTKLFSCWSVSVEHSATRN